MPRLDNFRKSIPHKNDEIYTPPILAAPILKYVKPDAVIWCPFDIEISEFVIQFRKAGHKVLHSHIATGQDFFAYEPSEHYDVIVSNPPFSCKLAVLDRLYKLDKPFAMVMGLPILNYQEIGEFFFNHQSDLQLLIVDKKISFDGRTSSFNNSYFCRRFLPKDIIFEHLPNNNSGRFFVGATQYVKGTTI